MNLWDLLLAAPFLIGALMAHFGYNFSDPKFYDDREENK